MKHLLILSILLSGGCAPKTEAINSLSDTSFNLGAVCMWVVVQRGLPHNTPQECKDSAWKIRKEFESK